MSTISFPNPHSPSHMESPASSGGHSHSNSGHVNFFPTSYDPQASASSFQVNPLSSHPPRTPRTSVVTATAANAFPRGAYGGGSGVEEREEKPYEDEEDAERLELRAGKRVRKEEVWREMLATSTGRDKALVCYSHATGRRALTVRCAETNTILDAGVSHLPHEPLEFAAGRAVSRTLSVGGGAVQTAGCDNVGAFVDAVGGSVDARQTVTERAVALRKCLILFNWLTPLTTITAPQPLPYTSSSKLGDSLRGAKKAAPQPLLLTFLHAPPPVLLDLLNSVSDDIATFSRLGLIGKRMGEKAAKLADWCWFSGTLVGLVEVGVEQGLVKNLMDESKCHQSLSDGG